MPMKYELVSGDTVQQDGRTARVFETFGLPFCCEGQRTLRQAAEVRGVPVDAVLGALQALGDPTAADAMPAEWDDLRVLVRHIVDRHHAYVRSVCPTLEAWLDRLVEHHGARHAELEPIRQAFHELADDLATHMMKEEHLLFPYITELETARLRGGRLPLGPFGTILNPIRVMETDHARAGALGTRLRALSGGYRAPADACTTYRLCYDALADFERDLHQHVHLENNVLFPRAIEIEQTLA